MRPDCYAAGVVNELDAFARVEQIGGQERGALITDESFECFTHGLDVSVKRECAREVRSTDHARTRLRNLDHIVQRKPHAVWLQSIEHTTNSITTLLHRAAGIRGELLVSVIDEISEDVLLTTVQRGRELDRGNDVQLTRQAALCLGDARAGIVVG